MTARFHLLLKRLPVLLVVLTLTLTAGRKYPDGWQYIPLPKDDEYATNRFGRSWLEPVYNGYLIVGDQYIDAPYLVEQRGFVIFVNNERIDDGTDIRLISPVPPEAPVTVDPGFPTNVTKNTPIADVVFNPVSIQKNLYWNHLGIYGQERLKITIEYYKQLPCIKEVIDNKEAAMGDSLVTMVDHNGNTLPVILQTSVKKPMKTATDPQIYGEIISTMGSRNGELSESIVLHVRDTNNPCIPGGTGAVWDTNKWMEVFKALADDITPSQRLARIRKAEIYGAISDNQIMWRLPMNGFKPTPQLWQRLSGDMSWTNDGPARMFALTNGWQKILPAFMRTQTVAVATMMSRPSDKTGTVGTQQPKKHGKVVRKDPSAATSTQESDDILMSSSSITWWFIGCTTLVVIGLVVLWRHNSKGRNV